MKIKKRVREMDYRSKCCGEEVEVHGMPDFIGSKEVCTVHFVCLGCGEPCDIKEKNRKMKAKSILHHDDPSCYGEIGDDGHCLKCGIKPNMQSTCIWWECPICKVRLDKMWCPQCGELLDEPAQLKKADSHN